LEKLEESSKSFSMNMYEISNTKTRNPNSFNTFWKTDTPIGPVERVMETVYITNKSRMIYTIEKYYIFLETKLTL
jgi:hypothetical protein